MRSPVAAGARLMLLTAAVRQAVIDEAEVGLPLSWRYGPADLPIDDEGYFAETVTFAGKGRRPMPRRGFQAGATPAPGTGR